MHPFKIFVLICLVLLSLSAEAGYEDRNHWLIPYHENIKWAEIPHWVEPGTYPEANTTSPTLIRHILHEKQVNLETDEVFRHHVMEVLEGGEECASSFSVEFDPSYQHIDLHRAYILRKGEIVYPPLKQEAYIMNNEHQLYSYIHEGHLTLYGAFHDVRVGDRLVYSYTLKGRNPIMGAHKSDVCAFESRVCQLEKLRYRLLKSPDRALTICFANSSLIPSKRLLDNGLEEICVETQTTEICSCDENVPIWFDKMPFMYVSDFDSWEQVSSWLEGVLPESSTFVLSPELEDLSLISDQKTKILAALRFVQKEIRYMGFEQGVFSFKPHPPSEVLLKRYGDCKDKTFLLKSILSKLGIASDPCLVSTISLHTIADEEPSHIHFDHMILRVSVDGKDYWLDPTYKFQAGSLEQCSQGHYGAALVAGVGLVTYTPSYHPFSVDRHLKILHSDDDLIDVSIASSFGGRAANNLRSALANQGTKIFEDDFFIDFSIPDDCCSTVSPPIIEDNQEENVILTEEHYQILADKYVDEEGKFACLFRTIENFCPTHREGKRQDPLALIPNVQISEKLHFSSDIGDLSLSEEEKMSFSRPDFELAAKMYIDTNHDLICKFDLQTHSDHIAAADVTNYLEELPEALSFLALNLWLPNRIPPSFTTDDTLLGYFLLASLVSAVLMAVWMTKTQSPKQLWFKASLVALFSMFVVICLMGRLPETESLGRVSMRMIMDLMIFGVAYLRGYKRHGRIALGFMVFVWGSSALVFFSAYVLSPFVGFLVAFGVSVPVVMSTICLIKHNRHLVKIQKSIPPIPTVENP